MADPFALPPVTPKTIKAISSAALYVRERSQLQADARDIIKGLVQHHAAKVTYPGWGTALRCGGIYTEVTTCCDLFTAKLLLADFLEKAGPYSEAADG